MERLKVRRDSRDGWYRIEPDDAEKLLKSDPIKNRPIGPMKVHRIAEKIRTGKWVANGETIILDASGKLADGQHRLAACVNAKIAIEAYVVHVPSKLSDGFFDSVDQGSNRDGKDLLAMDGVLSPDVASAVCRLVGLYERGANTYKSSTIKYSMSIREVYKENKEDVDHAVETVLMLKKEFKGWVPPSRIAFAYLMARRVNKSKADVWLNAVAFGEGLDATHPAMKLRKIMMAEALSRTTRRDDDSQMALITKS